MIIDPRNPPVCTTEFELFYSPVEDGRTEEGREERESLAGILCQGCPLRLACLEDALVHREAFGVWGGLGEGERRRFTQHLLDEGYAPHEIPSGKELRSALVTFYYYSLTSTERYHGELAEIA